MTITTKRTIPESSELAFGAITGTSAGTANAVLTLVNDAVNIGFENTTDVQLVVTLDGVQKKRVPAGSFRVFDLGTNGSRLAAGTVVGVFRAAGAPTSGTFEVVSMVGP